MPAAPHASGRSAQLRLWTQKWRWYERNSLPWRRARIHWEFMRREAFVRWPVHGNVLEALVEGRLEVGAGTLFEPGVWITAPGDARVHIGEGTFLNKGVMVAAQELVEIGSMYTAVAGLLNVLAIYDAYEGPAYSAAGDEAEAPTASEAKAEPALTGLKPEAQA